MGEVPGQGTVHVRQEAVDGESTYIRERARELGLTMRDLAASAGVTRGYLSQVSRGHRIMTVNVRARLEAALGGSLRKSCSRGARRDQHPALWDRMNAHDISQNKVAQQAGITSGHMSSIMSGKRNPSPTVLKKLHGVLFQPSKAELRVMPAEVKVLGWRKGERSGMVIRENNGQTARIGGRLPHGANVEFAYRTGYDGTGRTYVHHVVQRGCSALLVQREEDGS